MNADSLIEKTRRDVETELADDGSGHDGWHVYRVWTLAKKLAATRHRFMEDYLDRFFREWNGEA